MLCVVVVCVICNIHNCNYLRLSVLLQVVLAFLCYLCLLEWSSSGLVPELHISASVTSVMADRDIGHLDRCTTH